jgi:hypothetical protein
MTFGDFGADATFGDYTPEDAWCITDRPGQLLNNLRRRMSALDAGPIDFAASINDLSERLFAFLQAVPDLPPLIEQRADLLFHDLQTVQQLLDNEL